MNNLAASFNFESLAEMRHSMIVAAFLSITSGYSEPCPEVCKCTVAAISCQNVNESSWHAILLFLTAPDATTILEVDIRHGYVPTLHFFPYLQHLEVLRIVDTSLERIDLAREIRYPSLRIVDLSYNKIKMLAENSFVAVPNMEELSLRGNAIANLTYEYLKYPKLRWLDMAQNSIQSLPSRTLRPLTNLESLDLSGNKLRRVQSSDFSSLQRMRHLNLSRNQLAHFDFDTFAKNVRIEELDLSYNNFVKSPASDLKQIVNLLILNISGNPIEKISPYEFEFDRLQIFVASHMPSLTVIDASAFSKTRDLRAVDLSNNAKLAYISPSAFENCTIIHALDVSGSSLVVLFASVLQNVAQVKMAGSPRMNCECTANEVDSIASTTIDDWEKVTCTSNEGKLMKLSAAKAGDCRPRTILPFGNELTARVGSTYYLHCAAANEKDAVSWKLPNGTLLEGLETTKPFAHVMDYFSSSLYNPETEYIPNRPRLYASREWLRIDVVVAWDDGIYECITKRGRIEDVARLKLTVQPVHISVKAIANGPHYLSLAWNQTLDIEAVDRVALSLNIRDAGGFMRPIQLSLHNPWTTYNVMRLKPNTNYTVCLEYALAEALDRPIMSSCTEASTPQVLSFLQTVDLRVVVSIGLLILSCVMFNTVRRLYYRMHVWQLTKKRSRMAASLSGQSIVSHSSHGVGATYDNQQLALCRVDSAAETRSCLLTSDVPV